jgi:hypothetical protein
MSTNRTSAAKARSSEPIHGSLEQRIVQKAHRLDPAGLKTAVRMMTIYVRLQVPELRTAFSKRILRILATPSPSYDRTQARIERAIARAEANC